MGVEVKIKGGVVWIKIMGGDWQPLKILGCQADLHLN